MKSRARTAAAAAAATGSPAPHPHPAQPMPPSSSVGRSTGITTRRNSSEVSPHPTAKNHGHLRQHSGGEKKRKRRPLLRLDGSTTATATPVKPTSPRKHEHQRPAGRRRSEGVIAAQFSPSLPSASSVVTLSTLPTSPATVVHISSPGRSLETLEDNFRLTHQQRELQPQQLYAGPTFHNSPAPSALPVPAFMRPPSASESSAARSLDSLTTSRVFVRQTSPQGRPLSAVSTSFAEGYSPLDPSPFLPADGGGFVSTFDRGGGGQGLVAQFERSRPRTSTVATFSESYGGGTNQMDDSDPFPPRSMQPNWLVRPPAPFSSSNSSPTYPSCPSQPPPSQSSANAHEPAVARTRREILLSLLTHQNPPLLLKEAAATSTSCHSGAPVLAQPGCRLHASRSSATSLSSDTSSGGSGSNLVAITENLKSLLRIRSG